jgi:hypothetical protein
MEYEVQAAAGTLKKYRITVRLEDKSGSTTLLTIPVKAANPVDAIHKAWKKKRK